MLARVPRTTCIKRSAQYFGFGNCAQTSVHEDEEQSTRRDPSTLDESANAEGESNVADSAQDVTGGKGQTVGSDPDFPDWKSSVSSRFSHRFPRLRKFVYGLASKHLQKRSTPKSSLASNASAGASGNLEEEESEFQDKHSTAKIPLAQPFKGKEREAEGERQNDICFKYKRNGG